MSILQMLGMIYRDSGGGGGDSAFLVDPEQVTGGTSSGGAVSIAFDFDKYVTSDDTGNPVTWYTGTSLITDYEAKYTESSREGGGFFNVLGALPGTWYPLGGMNPMLTVTTDPPMWIYEAPGSSVSTGFLAIRNKNTLIELANVSCLFAVGDAA